jgi:hypothetical protein
VLRDERPKLRRQNEDVHLTVLDGLVADHETVVSVWHPASVARLLPPSIDRVARIWVVRFMGPTCDRRAGLQNDVVTDLGSFPQRVGRNPARHPNRSLGTFEVGAAGRLQLGQGPFVARVGRFFNAERSASKIAEISASLARSRHRTTSTPQLKASTERCHDLILACWLHARSEFLHQPSNGTSDRV